jgi:uncharacterized cupin superfamily protein
MHKVNIVSCDLDETLEDHGFSHVRRSVAESLGAKRIGATVYELQPGRQKSPFHYHYGWEEWLYVVSGAPVMRDLGGQRTLAPGDFVCFPSGAEGAHTLFGPGRVVLFSTGEEPFFTAYPDSRKLSTPFGIFRHEDALDYWDGEGTAGPLTPPEAEALLPESGSSLTAVNALSIVSDILPGADVPAGFRHRRARLGPPLGADMVGASLYELDPGEGTVPYHYEHGCEEWLLVLAGTPALRHPHGEDVLEPGDMVCFEDGPAGAHALHNRSNEVVRLVILSTKGRPVTVVYPDSRKISVYNMTDEPMVFGLADQVPFWDAD